MYFNKGQGMHHITQFMPQGSILSPFLWNVFIDSLLTPIHTQAYAVD